MILHAYSIRHAIERRVAPARPVAGGEGDFAAAKRLFRILTTVRPDAAKAWQRLGQVCESLGQHEEALRQHLEFMRLQPRWEGGHHAHDDKKRQALAGGRDHLRSATIRQSHGAPVDFLPWIRD